MKPLSMRQRSRNSVSICTLLAAVVMAGSLQFGLADEPATRPMDPTIAAIRDEGMNRFRRS